MNLLKHPRRLVFAAVIAVAACATASAPDMPTRQPETAATPLDLAQRFALAAPAASELQPAMTLWATHYHTPLVTPAPAGVSAAMPLIGRGGAAISAPLRHRDWCEAALQGSVSVMDATGEASAYVFIDSRGPEQANCDQWLGSLSDGVKAATRRARFMKVNHPFGCGVRAIPLTPFRTIAVDPDTIPIGSVVYVPALRGRVFTLNGKQLAHDGYLFAGDRGGAIKGAHIDVFHGPFQGSPFEDLFASTPSRTFAAHLVDPGSAGAAGVLAAQSGQCDPADS